MPTVTDTIEVSIDFEVWCSCGNGLCAQSQNKRGGIQVEPCERCLKDAWDEGYSEGQDSKE